MCACVNGRTETYTTRYKIATSKKSPVENRKLLKDLSSSAPFLLLMTTPTSCNTIEPRSSGYTSANDSLHGRRTGSFTSLMRLTTSRSVASGLWGSKGGGGSN